jgi:DNA-binding XRE family transcriptional regulator
MDVIKNIKTIRMHKGISHEAMALNLGISQTAYTKNRA